MANKYVDIKEGFYSAAKEPHVENEIEAIELYDIHDEEVQKSVVMEVLDEYQRRISENQPWHLQWIKNLSFISSNQYCDIYPEINDVRPTDKVFPYQQRKAYNMVAPIYETRLAQLNFVDYGLKARPVTNDQEDTIKATRNTKILKLHARNQNLPATMRRAHMWSEACGTSFIMPVWDSKLGRKLGSITDLNSKQTVTVYSGDLKTNVCSPFEILPDSPYCETIEENLSVLRTKVYKSQEVFDVWGVWVEGANNNVWMEQFRSSIIPSQEFYSGGIVGYGNVQVKDSVVVHELWERPTAQYPDGRLIIVAGETLLYYGALPFENKRDGRRGIPMIIVKSIDVPGCFWGKCIVERIIPIQEQYNAVKNRKMEILNYASSPVLFVEGNSVDLDTLTEVGIEPGAVIEYKRGFAKPMWADIPQVPEALLREEQDLINLFVLVSGVSEMAWRSQIPTNATSGPMLQIIQELDQTRLNISAKNSRNAVLTWGEMSMCISKQCISIKRIEAIVGDTDAYESLSWNQDDIEYYDIEFETENELSMSPAQRNLLVKELAGMGIFVDPKTGGMDELARSQLLSTLRIGHWESIAQRTDQQMGKARRNIELVKGGRLDDVRISIVDDNAIFIDEYTGFMQSDFYRKMIDENPVIGEFMEKQIQAHKDETQRKAEEDMTNQLRLQLQGQEMQTMAQVNLQNNVQQLAAGQNAAMQNKNANQTAANVETVAQPSEAAVPEGTTSQPEVSPANRMAELLAAVQ